MEVFGNGILDISGLTGAFFDPQHDPGTSIGSLEGTGMVFLGANQLRIGSNDRTTVFSGTIQDGGLQGTTGGSLVKLGAGELLLSGANTYTGGTAVEAGTLAVGGGAVFGSGPLAVNGGTLRLEGANRTANVAVDYVQNGGLLQLRIGGGQGGVNADLLRAGTVRGAAVLNSGSTLQLVLQNGFRLSASDRITLLETSGGLTGTFGTILGLDAFDSGTILYPIVTYDAFRAYLSLARGNFGDLRGLTPNEQAVAANLDRAVGDPRFAPLDAFLLNQPVAALPPVFQLIAPEELSAIYEIGFSQANVQSANLGRRLREIRAGSTGFSALGYSVSDAKGAVSEGNSGSVDAKESAPPSAMLPRPDNRWGVFVTGTGQRATVSGNLNASGYELTSGGISLGVDYRLGKNFALGVYGGYAHGENNLVHGGRIETNGGKTGAYATFHQGPFYLDGIAGAGLTNYVTQRAALSGFARGQTEGREFFGELAAGFAWRCGGFELGPRAAVRITTVSFDGFTEHRSLAPLRVSGDDEQDLESVVGWKIAREFALAGVTVRPEIGAAWKHAAARAGSYDIHARLASGAGGSFASEGPSLGRESALVSAGFSVVWSARYATFLFYDGEVGRSAYASHSLSGGLRISF